MAFCKPFASKNPSEKKTYLVLTFFLIFLGLIGCQGASACIRYPLESGASLVVGKYTDDPFTGFGKRDFFGQFSPQKPPPPVFYLKRGEWVFSQVHGGRPHHQSVHQPSMQAVDCS
jgi:hypothetical protein